MKEKELIGWGWAPTGYLPGLWVRYKITSNVFENFWTQQEGKCAGCKVEFAHPLRKLLQLGVKCEVDHKHNKDKLPCEAQDVRGLLCRRCNDFLGKIEDNYETLNNLANYLKNHGRRYE